MAGPDFSNSIFFCVSRGTQIKFPTGEGGTNDQESMGHCRRHVSRVRRRAKSFRWRKGLNPIVARKQVTTVPSRNGDGLSDGLSVTHMKKERNARRKQSIDKTPTTRHLFSPKLSFTCTYASDRCTLVLRGLSTEKDDFLNFSAGVVRSSMRESLVDVEVESASFPSPRCLS